MFDKTLLRNLAASHALMEYRAYRWTQDQKESLPPKLSHAGAALCPRLVTLVASGEYKLMGRDISENLHG